MLTVSFVISSSSSFEPSDSTRIDVHTENRQLQARLKNVISLDTMRKALEKKDADHAGAQKVGREKNEAAERKLASDGKLEEENAALKTAVEEVKEDATQLREEKVVLTDKVDQLTRKRDELEIYLGDLQRRCTSCSKVSLFVRVNL